jgi:hypothetical protein
MMTPSPLPSPWKASLVALAVCALVAAGLAVFAWPDDPLQSAVAGAVVFALLAGLEISAALRLRRALADFAEEVPGTADASTSALGCQALRWDDPPIEVWGRPGRLGAGRLQVWAGPWLVGFFPTREARRAAREALDFVRRKPGLAQQRPEPPVRASRARAASKAPHRAESRA